jgi:hypothetical protein
VISFRTASMPLHGRRNCPVAGDMSRRLPVTALIERGNRQNTGMAADFQNCLLFSLFSGNLFSFCFDDLPARLRRFAGIEKRFT